MPGIGERRAVYGPSSAFIDVFCPCHRYTELNGSDIAWPAGWSQEQAYTWRKENGLVPPMGEQVAVGQPLPQEGAQGDPDSVIPVPVAQTGILADPSNPTRNDEAPTA